MTHRRWLVVIVVCVLWGLATHGTHAGSGDEPHYLAIAHSLARDFDFDLSNNYGADEPLLSGGGLNPEHHTRSRIDGTLGSVHDVGLPLLYAPFARVGVPLVSWLSVTLPRETLSRLRLQPPTMYKHFVSALMILVTAALALVLFDVLSQFIPRRAEAFRWTLLIVLSSPLLVMSISFFTEVVSALLGIVVFRALVFGENRSSTGWFVYGALTGLLLLVHARNAGLIVGLVAFAAINFRARHRARDFVPFAAGVGTLIVVRTAINHQFWGTWLTSPHARAGEWTGVASVLTEIGRRAAGMLVDQEFGLLPYAPIFLLVPYGLVVLASRKDPAQARTNRLLLTGIVLVTGAYLAPVLFPITNAHGWTGGWSPVARFWVPVIPVLAIAVAAAARHAPRAVLIPIVVLQIGIDAYLWQNPKSGWNDGDGIAAVCTRSGTTFCRYLPSFVIDQERQRPAE